MNPVLARLIRTRIIRSHEGQDFPLHSDLPAAEGALLQHWLTNYQPKKLLEIGMAYGISTQFICDAICERRIDHYHIIDAHQSTQWHGAGFHNLEQAGYRDRFTLYEELSELILPTLLKEGMKYDFAYIDGWHSFDHALVEFFYVNRMLEVGGVIIFDDVHLPSLQKLLAYINNYDCYQSLALPESVTGSVQGKVRRMMNIPPSRLSGFEKVTEDQRDWDWFSDF